MTTTSFYQSDSYYEGEHDDLMTADDYDDREYHRNEWNQESQERQRF